MISRFCKKLVRILKHEIFWLALGLTLFMLQAVYFAYHTDPGMDEGTYAYKGYHFLTGRYQLNQDYGPWVNKMPLSFLIPGAAQVIFGGGLQTSRYYALFMSVLILVGVWLTVRRLGGKKAAVVVLLFMGISPFFIELYSQGLSQVLVACILTWSLAFSLGQDRKPWQLIAGAFFAGLIFVTRENMLPATILIILYIWWENGYRRMLPALAAMIFPVAVIHILYWPDILNRWLVWIPDFVIRWFSETSSQTINAVAVNTSSPDLFKRVYAFSHAIYSQIAFWAAICTSCLFWFGKKNDRNRQLSKIIIFLVVLLLILTAVHAAASVGGSYCLFCFENYIGFFAPLGWILFGLVIPGWMDSLTKLAKFVSLLITAVLSAMYGFGGALVLARFVLNLQVPRMRNMRILPGTTELWRFLANKFDWAYDFQKYLLPTLFAVGIGLAVWLIGWIGSILLQKRGKNLPGLPALLFLLLSIIAALFLRFYTITRGTTCQENVIASYSEVGNYLAETIPAGSWVYQGELPIVLLLYTPDVYVYPPQLNHRFNFFMGGIPDNLYREGFWNQELADRWIASADYVIVQDRDYTDEFADFIGQQPFIELPSSKPYSSCSWNSSIRIFKRAK